MRCKNWLGKSDSGLSTKDFRFEEEHSLHHSKKHKGLKTDKQ